MITEMKHAEIELPSRIDSMHRVEAMIDDIGSTLGLGEDIRNNMLVAVGEAVAVVTITVGQYNSQTAG